MVVIDLTIACPTLLFIQVHGFVGLTELYYAGSHGMDIMGPVRETISDDPPNCIRSIDEQVMALIFFFLGNGPISFFILHLSPLQ